VILVLSVVGWVMILIAFVGLSAAIRSTGVKSTGSWSPRSIHCRREESPSLRASTKARTSVEDDAFESEISEEQLGNT
jgi:hypothetical protein